MNTPLSILAQSFDNPLLPPRASTVAGDVDWLFNFVTLVTVFFSALIFVLMVYFAIRYRKSAGNGPQKSPSHNTALELTWTFIPGLIVLVIFFYGFRGYMHMYVSPPNAYEIQVKGYMWGWSFTYPNGHVDANLHVPRDRPIRLVLSSEDVIHAVYIPAFRVQKQVVPGRYNKLWFEATIPEGLEKSHVSSPEPGATPDAWEFWLFCNMYCGQSHAEMKAKVVVHEPDAFTRWLEEASDWTRRMTPAEAGQKFYTGRGCAQCHSLDGSRLIGPSFKDLYGRQEQFSDGSAGVADENYIRESILYPSRKIVAGYDNVMPAYLGQFKDRDIDAIIAWLKTLSVHHQGDGGVATPAAPPPPGQ